MDNATAEKRVDEALRVLGEHFENVQIFASTMQDGSEGGGTFHISKGTGNWFARYGQVRSWIIRSDAGEIDLDTKFRDTEDE